MNTLNTLINDFSRDNLILFFRQKLPAFRPEAEDYAFLFEDKKPISEKFQQIEKLGEAQINDTDELLLISAQTSAPLTNRSGKKQQYEIARKILKEEYKDAAFFVFYDAKGNFRFSFIHTNYIGHKKEYTNFKRYTYFVSPEQTNKTFISQVSKADFSDFKGILEAFSVEPVAKEFYIKLQHWYFWALQNVQFPEHAEKENNGRQVAVIRLITRLMFIWFMKVRKLIPETLFDENEIQSVLNDFANENSDYYKAILQNLFFATLNTKISERNYRSEKRGAKGFNPDFGNHHKYRFHDLVKDVDIFKDLFGQIPFLNGGLFECLDIKAKNPEEREYIDGFTATKKHQPKVPNSLFFAEPHTEDISGFYEEKNKKYETEGLIHLLKSYNFTIDENDPDDVEVALDPELLGSIFENLLASYNPETSTTARNATGSFYTPRTIVNYMTEQSLIQYFKDKLSNLEIENIDQKLEDLVCRPEGNPFGSELSRKITLLIDELRVLDPAVGSGAFPMALLNKLVSLLNKLDPDNRHWKDTQINSVKKHVKDSLLRKTLLEKIEEEFEKRTDDYGRKLYLIKKCIYGVDYQQIAVEIAKLRFFISLLTDETIIFDRPRENFGVLPLPNLGFEIMQGNSLISSYLGVYFGRKTQTQYAHNIEDEDYTQLILEFEELKNEYQIEDNPEKKAMLSKAIEEHLVKIFNYKLRERLPELDRVYDFAEKLPKEKQKQEYLNKELSKIEKRVGFDIRQARSDLKDFAKGKKAKDFFLWDVFFAEVFKQNDGFDIVIGNPPYIQLQKAVNGKQKQADLYAAEDYETFERSGDIYALFYEKGISLLRDKGVLCYITSNKWMRTNYGKSLREYLSKQNPLLLIDMGPGVFTTATVDTNILLVQKDSRKQTEAHHLQALTLSPDKLKTKTDEAHTSLHTKLKTQPFSRLSKLSEESWIILSPEEQALKEKIEGLGTPLKNWDVEIYRGILTGYNEAFIIDEQTKDALTKADPKNAEIIKPILRGRDIKRYEAKFADLWLIATFPSRKIDIDDYPAIRDYLKTFLPKIKQTGESYTDENGDKKKTRKKTKHKWFELQDQINYYEAFEKEKIIYPNMTKYLPFIYDKQGYYTNQKCFILTGKSVKYLTGYFNSKLLHSYIRQVFPELQGGTRELSKVFFINIPVPKITSKQAKPFEQLVDIIIEKKSQGQDTSAEERQIDAMVYKLYKLTYDEVLIIEPDFELSREEYSAKSGFD